MNGHFRWLRWFLLAIICLTQTGCIGIVGQLLQVPFQILGTLLQVIQRTPLPPPGVFF